MSRRTRFRIPGGKIVPAKIEGGYDHRRQILSKLVPLPAPFTLFISPTHKCNFRCFYCTHSKSAEEKKMSGFRTVDIAPEMVRSLAEQASAFHGEIKRVVFTGLGEPLMNPMLPDMIRMFAETNAAQGYEVITNAYLLTPDMTDRLLDAGLTYLRVSIQGVNQAQYEKTTGIRVDYDRLVRQLQYFYERKGDCQLYIKTMDASLESEEDQKQFFEVFSPICDKIYIEHLVKAQPSMSKHYDGHVNSEMTFFREPSEYREVCPYLFYILQVDSLGNVFPCPPLGFTEEFSLGNVAEKTLYEIWHGRKLFDLRMQHLNHARSSHPICGRCENYLCFTPKEDNLDLCAEEIRDRLEAEPLV